MSVRAYMNTLLSNILLFLEAVAVIGWCYFSLKKIVDDMIR
jgi:hypothetical protein